MATPVPALLALAALAATAAGCGGREQPEPVRNDAQRQAEQIAKQADRLIKQAENGAASIERALENEGAIIFENRETLLNQAAGAAADNAAQTKP